MSRSTHSRVRNGDNRRRYSQNFLIDSKVAAAIVRMSTVGSSDFVVEIGPGDGIVTRALARKAGRVLTYEIDPALAKRLQRRYADAPHVHCVNQDFLSSSAPGEPFQVVANLPYARTSRIIDWCLQAKSLHVATLMTQWEYARKRTGDYGRWTQVTVESWPSVEWRLLGQVRREKFRPVPRVDSGIIQLERRTRPLLPPPQLSQYRQLVALGFSGVGGSVAASLRRRFSARAVAAACHNAGVDQRAVVAYVSPEQWIALFHRLC